MADIKLWKKDLLGLVKAELQPMGFKLRAQTFIRKTDHGSDLFHLAFITHPGIDCDVTANLAVRHDATEELVNLYLPLPECRA